VLEDLFGLGTAVLMAHLFRRRKRWGEEDSCHEMVLLVPDVAEYVAPSPFEMFLCEFRQLG
jgi:hypothetical protein